jgi:alpha-amylase
MEKEAMKRIYALEEKVIKSENKDLIEVWGKLQTSDHFYYMCTKFWSDGDVHKYFSPYDSPYDAYIYYMNALADFETTIEEYYKDQRQVKKLAKKKETVE